jgi:transcription initiation factor TFIID subunit 8
MDKYCRQALNVAVAGLLSELGFQHSERMAHETLTERMQNLIRQIGVSAYSYCELARRTEPVIGDVIMALMNMGLSVEGIGLYAVRPGRIVILPPTKSTNPKQKCILKPGKRHLRPSHIPAHFPPFPGPLAEIRTPASKKPVTEYGALREKASIQKACIERALAKFVARTSETDSLFTSDDSAFPLIACRLERPPYLKALLTPPQYFDAEGVFSLQCADPGCQFPCAGYYSDMEGSEDIDNPYLYPPRLPRMKIRKM